MTYSYEETCKLLDIRRDTLYTYLSRGKLEKDGVGVSEKSVDAYINNRHESKRRGGHATGKIAREGKRKSKVRKMNREMRLQSVYQAFLQHFAEVGTAPILEDITWRSDLVKSGVLRYADQLVEEGKLVLISYRYYPAGLPPLIRKLVKEYYAKELEADT